MRLIGLFAYLLRAVAWKRTNYNVDGVPVKGDPLALPTHLVDDPFQSLVLRASSDQTVLGLVRPAKNRYIGFRTDRGEEWTCATPLDNDTAHGFRCFVPRESGRFFAVDVAGNQLPIQHLAVLTSEQAREYADSEFPRL